MHGEAGLSLTLTATLDIRETSHLPLQGTEAGGTTHRCGDTKASSPPRLSLGGVLSWEKPLLSLLCGRRGVSKSSRGAEVS